MAVTSPVWLITGCSRGFGREIARAVLERGNRAILTARDPSTLGDFRAFSPNVLSAALDVTDRGHIAQIVEQAKETFGRIDVLVNNAGRGYLAAIEEGEDDEVRALF